MDAPAFSGISCAKVEVSNKNARTVWALLAHGREYQPDYVSANAMAA